jgi:hypothetical protein
MRIYNLILVAGVAVAGTRCTRVPSGDLTTEPSQGVPDGDPAESDAAAGAATAAASTACENAGACGPGSTAPPAPPCVAKAVPVTVVLPDELADASNPRYEAYTGEQPVTFGVPFQRGCLIDADVANLRLRNGDVVIERASFDVTSRWDNQATIGTGDVRWLLVDAVVPITNSTAPPLTWLGAPHPATFPRGTDG